MIMTSSDSLSSGTTSHFQSSGVISPRPSLGITHCRPRDKRKCLQNFLKDFTHLCCKLYKARQHILNHLGLVYTVIGNATISFKIIRLQL